MFFLASMALAFIASDTGVDSQSSLKTIDAAIHEVYVPTGFDDNDNAQFVVAGEFANTCQTIGPAKTRIDYENRVVYFEVIAYENTAPCLQVRTPFMKVIETGVLAEGTYGLVNVKAKERLAQNLHIRQAPPRDDGTSPRQDNYLYAPVEGIFLQTTEDGNRNRFILHGSFNNSCMHFGETPVWVKNTAKGVIEILPVITMDRGEACLDVLVPFFKTVEIPQEIPAGRYLFHVRAMNGVAINKVDTIVRKTAP